MSAEPATPPPEVNRSGRKWVWMFVGFGLLAVLAGLLYRHFANQSLSSDDPPEKVYQMIFDAYGGQAALDKWKCGVVKYESTDDFPGEPHRELQYTEAFWLPGKVRLDKRETVDGHTKRLRFGSNGMTQWLVDETGALDVRPARSVGREEYAEFTLFFHPAYLLWKGEKIGVKGIESRSDGGRDLVVFVDRSNPDVGECRVDAKTKLLRGFRGKFEPLNGGESISGQYEYSDYQKTDGGPVPGRITIYKGDQKIREIRFLSVEFREYFGPAEFDPPEDQQP